MSLLNAGRLTRDLPAPFTSTLERTCLDLLNGNDGTGHVCGEVLMVHAIRPRKTTIYSLIWRSEPTGLDRRVEYQFEVQITGEYHQEIPIRTGQTIKVALRGARNNYTSVGKGTSLRMKLPLNLCFGSSVCVWVAPCKMFEAGYLVDFAKLQEQCRERDSTPEVVNRSRSPTATTNTREQIQQPPQHPYARPSSPTPPPSILPAAPHLARPTSPSPPQRTFRFISPVSTDGPPPTKRLKANHIQSPNIPSTDSTIEHITTSLKKLRTKSAADDSASPSKAPKRPLSNSVLAPHFLPSPPDSSRTSQASTPAPGAPGVGTPAASALEPPSAVTEKPPPEAPPSVKPVIAQTVHPVSGTLTKLSPVVYPTVPKGLTTKAGVRYLALADASNAIRGDTVSLMGVITTVKLGKSSSTDRYCTFTIADPTLLDGFGVNLFVKERDKDRLPSAAKRGHVLLVQDVQIDTFNGVNTATGSSRQFFRSVVLNPDSNQLLYSKSRMHPVMVGGCDSFVTPVGEELSYMAKLAQWYEFNRATVRDPGANKYRLLADVKENDWFDCTVEVRSVNPGSKCTELIVTDYSLHDGHIMDTSRVKELLIEVWGRENAKAREMKGGMMCTLFNVNLRRRTRDGLLRGKMGSAGGTTISQASAETEPSSQFQALLGRKGKHDSLVSRSYTLRCHHLDQRCSSFEEVQHGACPNKFRIRARVGDIFPYSVKDVVIQMCRHCSRYLPKEATTCWHCKHDTQSHRDFLYRFWLLLQDSTGKQLKVMVREKEAASLLPTLDPLDVQTNERWDELGFALRALLGPEAEAPSEVDLCIMSWTIRRTEADLIDDRRLGEVELGLERCYALFGCSILVGASERPGS